MHWLDWLLVTLPLIGILIVIFYTRRYVRSVADFIAAGRCAGRYLLANARGEAGYGLATALAIFEIVHQSGFTTYWWGPITGIPLLIISISGFVIYRYRQTRALTLPQFLEMRYSRPFRFYAGSLAFIAGTLNYAVLPGIQARFFVYFLGLPHTVQIGPFHVETFIPIMLAYVIATMALVLNGGQITLMVTDCLEGMFSQILYVIIIIALLYMISWNQITEVLSAQPPGKSLINPFDAGAVKDFNIWFVIIGFFMGVYGTMAWQGGHGFNSAALNPHESRMGGVLGRWREFARSTMIICLGVCAVTFYNHASFSAAAVPAHVQLESLPQNVQTQMKVPVALSHLLPMGIKGCFCILMIMAMMASDAMHLHSWGSIFIQDMVLPVRKTPLPPAQHLHLLRWAAAGVAIFAVVFSLLFQISEQIYMWWSVTGAIYLGGAGSIIIGGLYWKRGTTPGAWAAMTVGSVLAFGGVLYKQYVDRGLNLDNNVLLTIAVVPATIAFICMVARPRANLTRAAACAAILAVFLGGIAAPFRFFVLPHFALNGQIIGFIAALAAIATYILVSLLTGEGAFDMDRMLHRGKYAVADDAVANAARPSLLVRLIGIDSNFTRGDKIIAGGLFFWSSFWFIVVLSVTLWILIRGPLPLGWWSNYWLVFILVLPTIIAIGTTVWFTWGGIHDLRTFFVRIRAVERDAHDDGTVEKGPPPADNAFPVVVTAKSPNASDPATPR